MVNKLKHWVQKVSEYDFPIFQSTINALSNISVEDDTSASELTSVILRDPSLSAKILKFANSSYYNPSQAKTYTVSRAVVLMGFDVVRDIGLSLAIIESFLGAKSRTIVSALMAKSFHAATQARNLARENGEKGLEEIFLAALLHNLGEMVFWCVADDELVDKLLTAMEDEEYDEEEAQESILGFKLADLTHALVSKWNMNKILADTLSDTPSDDSRKKYIHFGVKLAETLPDGIESEKAKKVCKQLAGQLGRPLGETKKIVREGLKQATEVASSYGASSVVPLMPGNDEFTKTVSPEKDTILEPVETVTYPEPDPLLQLQILRDLSVILKSSQDLNLIIETLLEGIHRGIGLDRALFALFTPIKSQIRGKFTVGINADTLLNHFSFNVGDVTNNPFNEVLLENQTSLWMRSNILDDYSRDVMKKISDVLGTRTFFIAPLVVNSHPIGLFYADRQPSKRPLDQESFEGFEHFTHQATLAVESLSRKK